VTTTEQPLFFNPFDPDFRVDPYPTYKRFREEDPVHKTPFGPWVVSRYADCVAILRDPRSSSDATKSNEFAQFAAANPRIAEDTSRPFLFMDPPDHTRLRGLVSKAFTPKVVEGLRPRIQQIVDQLIASVVERGSLEVIEDLAYPLPVQVISEMLGVPPEDHETFKGWSAVLARSLDPDLGTLPPEEIERREKIANDFVAYFEQLFDKRRKDPRDDLLSALLAAEEEGDKLSPNELVTTCILLLVAGHETTVNLIGNGVLALLRHPDQLARLRADPSLDKSAVEEFLRFDPPVQFTVRTMLDEYAIGDRVIAKGEQAIVGLASANRDASQFTEPDHLDVARSDNRHVAFGFGAHFCLGAPLARAEGQIALGTLVRRLDGLELLDDPPEYKENLVLRGLAKLRVGFSDSR